MKVHNTHFGLFTTECYLLLSEVIGFIKRSISNWVKPKPVDMLRINLSQAEIVKLRSRKYFYSIFFNLHIINVIQN
jgi:hypothetical protein